MVTTLTTYTGLHMSVLNPKEDMIHINDIAHALSNMCRYAGHMPKFYSVAQHSIHCYGMARKLDLNKKIQLAALLHDATEAYMCDLPKSVKALLPEYKYLENRLMKVIASKYAIQFPFDPMIKKLDIISGQIEKRWMEFDIVPESKSEHVKARFLHIFYSLTR